MKRFSIMLPWAVIGLFVVVAIWFQSAMPPREHFVQLASAFLHGQLSFMPEVGVVTDEVVYQGKSFWALGPLPAILLMPVVQVASWFGTTASEGYLHFFLGVLVFVLTYGISRRFKFSTTDSLWLGIGFCFTSPFLGIFLFTWSWFFAQLITVVLLMLTLYEWQGKKRFWLIGLLLAGVVATRFTAGVGIIFFLLTILFSHIKIKTKILQLLQLCIPFFLALVLLGIYNFARFGSPLETGYSWQAQVPAAAQAREYGVFSLQHIPGNLYYVLVGAPQPVFTDTISHVLRFPFVRPDPWGMSLLITSPYLLYLFLFRPRDKQSVFLWLTIGAILIPLLLFYSSGYFQFGYRYALDFFPWLFFLLLHQYRQKKTQLSVRFKLLLLLPALWNAYLICSLSMLV